MKKFNLDIPKMGYFLLVEGKPSFVTKQIKKMQRKHGFSEDNARFNHVEVMGGGQYSVRVAPPATRIIDITKLYKGLTVRIVKLKEPKKANRKVAKIAFWAASHCNLKYDWFGVVKFRIKWLFHVSGHWFCSENSLWAARKEFPKTLEGLKDYQCMPAHFTDKNYFETVWEGVIE